MVRTVKKFPQVNTECLISEVTFFHNISWEWSDVSSFFKGCSTSSMVAPLYFCLNSLRHTSLHCLHIVDWLLSVLNLVLSFVRQTSPHCLHWVDPDKGTGFCLLDLSCASCPKAALWSNAPLKHLKTTLHLNKPLELRFYCNNSQNLFYKLPEVHRSKLVQIFTFGNPGT